MTAISHLRDCGFVRVPPALVDDFVNLIFETQNRKPFFHVEGPLPFCWNAPKEWGTNHILYQWGHLRSRNQNVDAHDIHNLCLMSARCNGQVQTSMDIDEVIQWLDGSAVAKRACEVLERRRALFESEEWQDFLGRMRGFQRR